MSEYNPILSIDLRTIARSYQKNIALMLIVIALVFAFRLNNLVQAPKLYEVTMELISVSALEQDKKSLQVDGLESILSGSSPDEAILTFQAVMASRMVAKRITENTDLLQRFYADQYDNEENTWIKPEGTAFTIKEYIKKILNLPAYQPPDYNNLRVELSDAVEFNDLGGGIIEMTILHPDPELASALLDAAYYHTEAVLREKSQARALTKIRYLKERVDSVTNVDYRRTLYNNIAVLEQTIILETDSMATMLEKAGDVSYQHKTYSLFFFVFSSLILGFLAASLILLLSYLYRLYFRVK